MLIIVTFLDAAQLSWVQANLKSLPTWPAIASLNVQKSAVHTSFGGFIGEISGFPGSPAAPAAPA
jgi:hypothetical protein